MTYLFTSKILIIFEEHFSKVRCIKGHFSFGRNTNGRCPFLWRDKIQGMRKKFLNKKIKTDYPLIKCKNVDIIEVKEK